jgi:hypothetical protein
VTDTDESKAARQMHDELGCVGATVVLQSLERGGAEASCLSILLLKARADER